VPPGGLFGFQWVGPPRRVWVTLPWTSRGAGAARRLARIPVGRTAEGLSLFAMDIEEALAVGRHDVVR